MTDRARARILCLILFVFLFSGGSTGKGTEVYTLRDWIKNREKIQGNVRDVSNNGWNEKSGLGL